MARGFLVKRGSRVNATTRMTSPSAFAISLNAAYSLRSGFWNPRLFQASGRDGNYTTDEVADSELGELW